MQVTLLVSHNTYKTEGKVSVFVTVQPWPPVAERSTSPLTFFQTRTGGSKSVMADVLCHQLWALAVDFHYETKSS